MGGASGETYVMTRLGLLMTGGNFAAICIMEIMVRRGVSAENSGESIAM
jgi:hypothetical protein